MTGKFFVRRFQNKDVEAWCKLWHDYNEDYIYARDPAVTESNWRTIMSNDGRLNALALISGESNRAVGFALYVLYHSTKTILPDCYLSDLFISPENRRQGGGRHLLEKVLRIAWKKRQVV